MGFILKALGIIIMVVFGGSALVLTIEVIVYAAQGMGNTGLYIGIPIGTIVCGLLAWFGHWVWEKGDEW